jgi:hypothetical protein
MAGLNEVARSRADIVSGWMKLFPMLRIKVLAAQTCHRPSRWSHASQRDGVTMNTGLYRIARNGLPGVGDWLSRRPAGYSKIGLIGSAVALVTVG